MKLKDILNEGTWSSPNTVKRAQQLAQLMQKPIRVENASDVLYNLIGDDGLFDDFYEAEKDGPDTDVRFLVASKLQEWLKDLEGWRDPWDPQAVKILQQLVKKFVV